MIVTTDQSLSASVRRVAVGAALLFAVICSGCGEEQLKSIASNVDRVAVLIQSGREVRDELHALGVIDNQDAYRVTWGLYKVNATLKAFNNRARTYQAAGQLTPDDKALLRKLAEDISGAATELVADGTFGIKNRDAQVRINAAIGAIKQATLAIVDAVDRLKTKTPQPPIQTQGADLLGILPLLLLAIRKIVDFVEREKARTGKTAEEIYADAGLQLDANDLALVADLAKYAPPGEVPTGTSQQ